MPSPRRKKPAREIYDLDQSPFAQRLTQRKLATLLQVPLQELRGLCKYKRAFVVSRDEIINGKLRHLCYPIDRLRKVNERVKFHLDKIRLPSYVMSPRKSVGQKDNALAHINATQVLKLDLRKFYPSITRKHLVQFFCTEFRMHDDVARLIADLLTLDGIIFFGAPATPVMAMLTFKKMFDEIDVACQEHGTTMTLWVDNITISGEQVPGALLDQIRAIIASYGHKSHDIVFLQTNRFTKITGVNVKQGALHPANSSNIAIRELEKNIRSASTPDEYERAANTLLARLGSQLHIVGLDSERGHKISQRMNTIRQKRYKRIR